LPTPPLPEATATTFLTRGMSGVVDPWPRATAVLEVILMLTSVTHGSRATAIWAWSRNWSLTGQAGVVRLMLNATAPFAAMFMFWTKPSDTMSRCRSGSFTTRSASRTSWSRVLTAMGLVIPSGLLGFYQMVVKCRRVLLAHRLLVELADAGLGQLVDE